MGVSGTCTTSAAKAAFQIAIAFIGPRNSTGSLRSGDFHVLRDEVHRAALQKMGWRVLEIWECEIDDTQFLKSRIEQFLNVQ